MRAPIKVLLSSFAVFALLLTIFAQPVAAGTVPRACGKVECAVCAPPGTCPCGKSSGPGTGTGAAAIAKAPLSAALYAAAPAREAHPSPSSTPASPLVFYPAPAAPPATANAQVRATYTGAPTRYPHANVIRGYAPAAAFPGQWSLLNLWLAALCLMIGIAQLPALFRRNPGTWPQASPKTKAPARRRNTVACLLALTAGMAAPVLFLLAEDLANPQVFVNQWSSLMLAILGVQLIAALLLRRTQAVADDTTQTLAQAAQVFGPVKK